VLQEGEFERLGGSQIIKVGVRVIAATNRERAQLREGRFREDTYSDRTTAAAPRIVRFSRGYFKEFSISMGRQIDGSPTLDQTERGHIARARALRLAHPRCWRRGRTKPGIKRTSFRIADEEAGCSETP